MTQIRRMLLVLGLGLVTALPAPAAMPFDPVDRARAFAICFGRYSAATDHAWLIGTDRDTARARRDTFATLLDAVAPAAGRDVAEFFSYRVGARRAIVQLAHTAGSGDARATMAANMARRMIVMCDDLI